MDTSLNSNYSNLMISIHTCTYLLAVCLFSISFLVFLNASGPFVITDLLGIKNDTGDLVGTLGFVDELVALFACPLWGILSDRIGVRNVCVTGYTIVGISLFIFVHAHNVYPQLLIARAFFSIGGAATATMVTGILPIISSYKHPYQIGKFDGSLTQDAHNQERVPSLSCSQTTITPENYQHSTYLIHSKRNNKALQITNSWSSPPRLAGLVGFFTGCGALVALVIFLPLPAQLSRIREVTQKRALIDSFYAVGAASITVAFACFFGLKDLLGEENKCWRSLIAQVSSPHDNETSPGDRNRRKMNKFIPYWLSLIDSFKLGFRDTEIGLGYAGGFVARASSVGISLFIPTYVNAFYYQHGLCNIPPNNPSSEMKKECRIAYVLASELTGTSQLFALIFAPIFGYFTDRYRRFNLPIMAASILGIIGHTGFALLKSPEPTDIDGRGGSPLVFLFVSLIGISQIGAIVCSLGLLGRGIVSSVYDTNKQPQNTQQTRTHADALETIPLISSHSENNLSQSYLKGSVAGIYSLSGSAAILLLTKLGGYFFDNLSTGAPFYMMSIFNGFFLAIGIGVSIYQEF